jgi:ribosome-associated protein
MLHIADDIVLDMAEIKESFIRSTGPGGQNVNKVSTAVEMRFDARRSPSLPQAMRARLEKLAGQRLTSDGIIVIVANRFRSQHRNRQDALERLIALLKKAAEPPRPRHPTRPTRASKQRRADAKRRRSAVKALRRSKPWQD